MSEPKWKIGDVVEFIPGNYLHEGYNVKYWLEGIGIIMIVSETHYLVQTYRLVKVSPKNFATYDIGSQMLKLPIKDVDASDCFRLFDY